MTINEKINEMKQELIESTQEVLRIKSVGEKGEKGMPYGKGVGDSLKCVLDMADRLGFKTVNLDGYAGYAEYGNGEEYVAVLGHLDVVPEGEGWLYPPYSAEIHDGKLYARGSLDDKGPMIAAMYGLKAIKELNLPLSKKVRIIFGTDEETGSGEDIAHYLKNEKAPVAGFTPDAEYPIIYAEKGLTVFDIVKDLNKKQNGDVVIKYIKGGQRPNIVPEYCEAGIAAKNPEAVKTAVLNFKNTTGHEVAIEEKDDLIVIKAYGVSAHGSLPHLGKNAIMILFALLESLNMEEADITAFIAFMNKYVGMESDGKAFGVGLEDEPSGKLSFNIGIVDMNEEKVIMTLNLRYPVTFKLEDMVNPFNKRLEGSGIKMQNLENQSPLYFSKEHPLIQALQKVYTDQTGEEATLLAIGGGTYAKAMPNVVAFGPVFPGKPDIIHQPNEYIEIEDLILNAQIYGHAIYELAK